MITDFLIEFLFGALFKVLYVYRIPRHLRYVLALFIVAIYILIEYFLAHMALVYYRDGNTYMICLCAIGFIVFGLLIVVGFLHQKKNME